MSTDLRPLLDRLGDVPGDLRQPLQTALNASDWSGAITALARCRGYLRRRPDADTLAAVEDLLAQLDDLEPIDGRAQRLAGQVHFERARIVAVIRSGGEPSEQRWQALAAVERRWRDALRHVRRTGATP